MTTSTYILQDKVNGDFRDFNSYEELLQSLREEHDFALYNSPEETSLDFDKFVTEEWQLYVATPIGVIH